MEDKLILLRRRLVGFSYRALNELQFFPFTLLFVLFNAVLRAFQLRLRHMLVRVGEAAGDATLLPRQVMLWLDRTLAGRPGHQFDVCLRLPREAANDSLHDAFSVLLAFPGLRSIGLYWDSSNLADDLLLLQAKRDQNDPSIAATPYEDLGSPGVRQLEQFLQACHGEIALPVAAARDAQTLLKRQAGGGCAVCLNIPPEHRFLADFVVKARPDIWFFDLSFPTSQTTSAANHRSISGHGLSLHERMALAGAADAYVGSFDELGCTAVISRRPAILFGGGVGTPPGRISSDDNTVWFPVPAEPTTLAEEVLQILSRNFAPVT
ncbi:MAG TPA: hypothetical protein VJT81_18965 [Burkholderiales bacterium]|nr:hypothetical protein [Burkholderiales bacterium]